jgi:hypothetical protein
MRFDLYPCRCWERYKVRSLEKCVVENIAELGGIYVPAGQRISRGRWFCQQRGFVGLHFSWALNFRFINGNKKNVCIYKDVRKRGVSSQIYPSRLSQLTNKMAKNWFEGKGLPPFNKERTVEARDDVSGEQSLKGIWVSKQFIPLFRNVWRKRKLISGCKEEGQICFRLRLSLAAEAEMVRGRFDTFYRRRRQYRGIFLCPTTDPRSSPALTSKNGYDKLQSSWYHIHTKGLPMAGGENEGNLELPSSFRLPWNGMRNLISQLLYTHPRSLIINRVLAL